jgi:hypothetical protein
MQGGDATNLGESEAFKHFASSLSEEV